MNVSISAEQDESQLAHPKGRVGLAVLGMHRSGTSALARVLSLLGAELPQRLMGASHSNETGHWEPQKLADLNNQVLSEGGSRWDDWRSFDSQALREKYPHFRDAIASCLQEDFGDSQLFVLKDPRICRLVPVYRDVTDQLRVDLRFVIPYRNATEVAASLNARDRMSIAYGKLLWARHILDAEAFTRGSKRVFVPYDALLSDFEGVCDRIGSSLKVEWPIPMDDARANIAAFIRSDLRHHRAPGDSLSNLDVVDGFVNQILASIERLERDPCDEQAMRTLSSLREELGNPQIRFVDVMFDEFAERQARLRSHVEHIQQDAEMKSIQLSQAQQEIELKSEQLAEALRDAGVMSEQLRHLQAALQTETMKLEEVQRQQFQSLSEIAAAEARADRLENGLNEILSSFSWRATRLVRVLGSVLGGPATEDPRSSAK